MGLIMFLNVCSMPAKWGPASAVKVKVPLQYISGEKPAPTFEPKIIKISNITPKYVIWLIDTHKSSLFFIGFHLQHTTFCHVSLGSFVIRHACHMFVSDASDDDSDSEETTTTASSKKTKPSTKPPTTGRSSARATKGTKEDDKKSNKKSKSGKKEKNNKKKKRKDSGDEDDDDEDCCCRGCCRAPCGMSKYCLKNLRPEIKTN